MENATTHIQVEKAVRESVPRLDVNLNIQVSLFDAWVNAYSVIRQTMDPEIRKRHDLIFLAVSEWFWREVVKIKVPEI